MLGHSPLARLPKNQEPRGPQAPSSDRPPHPTHLQQHVSSAARIHDFDGGKSTWLAHFPGLRADQVLADSVFWVTRKLAFKGKGQEGRGTAGQAYQSLPRAEAPSRCQRQRPSEPDKLLPGQLVTQADAQTQLGTLQPRFPPSCAVRGERTSWDSHQGGGHPGPTVP